MIPIEVERLQTQLTEDQLSPEEFVAILLSMYELETSKTFLRTVIHNVRVLMTETVWGEKYLQAHIELVERYEEFFCEKIDHGENIERRDLPGGSRGAMETQRTQFDDENADDLDGQYDRFLEPLGGDFQDDGGCQEDETTLAFNLSLNETQDTSPKSQLLNPKRPSNSKKKMKQLAKYQKCPVILWLRRDLRLYDNPALVTASSLARPVIPVFVWNEEEEGKLAAGGATKVWLEEALKVFGGTLSDRYGSRLILRRTENVHDEVVKIVQETGAKDVVWTVLYEPALKERDQRVEKSLHKMGVKVHIEDSYLLHRPDQMTVRGVGAHGIGSVTHFMECCKQNPSDKIGTPVNPPLDISKPQEWPRSHNLSDLGLYAMPRRRDGTYVDWARGIRENWTFGEEGGYANLRRFLDESVQFYENESGRADKPWTAVISPYLHWGELSPRLVLHEAFVGKIAAKFRRKLAWRDLSYWLLSLFPSMDQEPVRPPFKHQRWNEDRSLLKKWQKGMTGYPLVDAAMRQLWAIGWMNNYMRHVVASFLMSYLRFSWVDGYSWFQDTLVDADVAINAMMWQNGGFSGMDQWNFVMHPVNAAMTCDPRGDFVRRWVPELAGLSDKFIHQPWKASPSILKKNKIELGVNYPQKCILDLEEERGKSLMDVVEVRRTHGKGCIDPQYGRDMVPIPYRKLGLESKNGRDLLMVPLITRKEFIFKTGNPESEDNPFDPVLKGYVSREKDEEVARTNKVDFTASTMLEIADRKGRLDRINGIEDKEEGSRNRRGPRKRNPIVQ